jgi:hypothetical protein
VSAGASLFCVSFVQGKGVRKRLTIAKIQESSAQAAEARCRKKSNPQQREKEDQEEQEHQQQVVLLHYYYMHGDKLLKCLHPGCDKVFDTQGQVNQHFKTHGDKRVQCLHPGFINICI